MSELSLVDAVWLRHLLPSLSFRLGLGAGPDRIGLPAAQRYVVVLVDGLGWDIILPELAHAPYLAGIVGDSQRAATGLPSTTAASLTSLWTGLPPGLTGIVGFTFDLDGRGTSAKYPDVIAPLYLRQPLDLPTSWPDRLVEAGVAVTWVIPPDQVKSAFTAMGTRRARLVGLEPTAEAERIEAIVQASRSGERSLTYVYDGRVDHTGHGQGVASRAWRAELARVDRFLGDLRDGLPDDVRLIVTGDHGMIDVAPTDKVVIEDNPALARDLRLVAGEARCRFLYTAKPAAVASRWADQLGDQAWVLTRAEAIGQGVFGQVDPAYASRIGDVVVLARAGQAYLSHRFPAEFKLIGFHGAGTPAERYVPIAVD